MLKLKNLESMCHMDMQCLLFEDISDIDIVTLQ